MHIQSWVAPRPTASAQLANDLPSTKKGKVTVPGKMSKDVPKGTHNSVLKQAGLKS